MRVLRWERPPYDPQATSRLADALQLDPTVARLMCLRGLADPDAAARFLNPSLDHLHDPFLLTDLPKGVERLLEAIDRRERIAVHGDYDVDGVTSTVILYRALSLLGADVVHFVPDRLRDGYGLQPEAIERLAADGIRVVVSVDCGIRSNAAAQRARECGVDLIITDHHEPDVELPRALAVINPRRPDCHYPDKNLAGAGVAFKVVQALCMRRQRERWLPSFIKVAAIGTMADIVPLVGENRVIAKHGLDLLSRGPNTVGLRALIDAAGLTGRTLDSFHVSFLIAPRVNAAGRMSTPDLATRLLLAVNEDVEGEARELAAQLNAENLKRQEEEADILKQARHAVETDPAIGAHAVIVVAGEGWHRGVIGIVASKLVEAFHRPAIVLSLDGDAGHGSCRSIAGFDVLGALERCDDLFLRFGGHPMAAGLTMEAGRVSELRTRINAFADEVLLPDDLVPRLRIDAPLTFRGISGRLVEGLGALEPFGAGNARPVFDAGRVEIVEPPRVVKDRHLKLVLRQDGRVFRAMAWRGVERMNGLDRGTGAELAFSLAENVYQGERYVELTVADVREPRYIESEELVP